MSTDTKPKRVEWEFKPGEADWASVGDVDVLSFIAYPNVYEVRARVDGGEWMTPMEVRLTLEAGWFAATAMLPKGMLPTTRSEVEQAFAILDSLLGGTE